MSDIISACKQKPTDECISQLAKLLHSAIRFEDKVEICSFLGEHGNQDSFEALISLLKDSEARQSGLSVHVLYSLDSYDCSDELELLVHIFLRGTYHKAWYALDIIGEMEGPFETGQLEDVLQLVEASQQDPEKQNFTDKLVRWLRMHSS